MSNRFSITVGTIKSQIHEPLSGELLKTLKLRTSYKKQSFRVLPVFAQRVNLLNNKQQFPSGLLRIVKKTIKEFGFKVKVHDIRPKVEISEDEVLTKLDNFSANLRDYQIESVLVGMQKHHGLFWHPTGSGKGVLISALLNCFDLESLILIHRRELLYQLSEKISSLTGQEVGMVGDGLWEPKKWTVGLINSFLCGEDLDKRDVILKYLKGVEYFLADECFVAGTKVNIPDGYANIEDIKIGDIVCSFDDFKGEFVNKRVVRLYKKIPNFLIKLKIENEFIFCTPNHKFLTKNGWKKAEQLSCDDMVLTTIMSQEGGYYAKKLMYVLWKSCLSSKKEKECSLQRVQEGENVQALQKIEDKMHMVWKRFACLWKKIVLLYETWSCILQRYLQKGMDVEAFFRSYGFNQSQICFCADVKEQSYERPKNTGKSQHKITCYGSYYKERISWWQRKTIASSTAFIGKYFRLGNRNCCQHKQTRRCRQDSSILLQNRYSKQKTKNWYRSGWEFPLFVRKTKSRQEERTNSHWSRVEDIEIQKQTSDGRFGGLCKDGFVYNLEVEDTHTYQVNNIVVSNCHHLGSQTWTKISRSCINTKVRHGFSGTCFRTDYSDLLLLASTGDVISKYTTSYMIENGWLSRPIIEMKYMYKKTDNKTWHAVEDDLIVDNHERNMAICDFTIKRCEKDEQVLIIVKKVRHGSLLQDMFINQYGIEKRNIRYMNGSEEMFVRKKALEDFKYGKFQILIGTSIYNEGVDLPSIGAAVNAAGGDSDIATTQKLGRAIRKTLNEGEIDVEPEEEQTIHYLDFFDNGHSYVRKHSRSRKALYESEKSFRLKVTR